MKRGVNSKSLGQLEPVRNRVDSAKHFKGSNVMGGKFAGFNPQGKVLGGQPDLLAKTKVQGWSTVAVGLRLVGPGCPQQCLTGHQEVCRTPTTPGRKPGALGLISWGSPNTWNTCSNISLAGSRAEESLFKVIN